MTTKLLVSGEAILGMDFLWLSRTLIDPSSGSLRLKWVPQAKITTEAKENVRPRSMQCDRFYNLARKKCAVSHLGHHMQKQGALKRCGRTTNWIGPIL